MKSTSYFRYNFFNLMTVQRNELRGVQFSWNVFSFPQDSGSLKLFWLCYCFHLTHQDVLCVLSEESLGQAGRGWLLGGLLVEPNKDSPAACWTRLWVWGSALPGLALSAESLARGIVTGRNRKAAWSLVNEEQGLFSTQLYLFSCSIGQFHIAFHSPACWPGMWWRG